MEPSTAAHCADISRTIDSVVCEAAKAASSQAGGKTEQDTVSVVDSLAPTPPAVLTDELAIRADRDRRIGATIDEVITRVVHAPHDTASHHLLMSPMQIDAYTAPLPFYQGEHTYIVQRACVQADKHKYSHNMLPTNTPCPLAKAWSYRGQPAIPLSQDAAPRGKTTAPAGQPKR